MTENAEPKQTRRAQRIEFFSVLLIALTTVLTAWTGFEASKWGGVMSIDFSSAAAARTESIRASNVANRETTVDVSLFTAYAEAVSAGDDVLADFLYERFPDRLEVAAEAWLATRPLEDPDAPGTPFDMPEYDLESATTAERLEQEADARSAQAREANQRGDNYTIMTIFLAGVLLLAALSVKVDRERLQLQLIGVATVIFVIVGVVVATYPVEI